jgi:hypothetical protein
MKQILHIFAKDTRHLWLEILISLALLAALVLTSLRHFLPGTNHAYGFTVSLSSRGGLGLLATLLTPLIPVSWWILISPVIHEERLVGDRQFWITRPYEWKNLLAAKALFILVYLYLPLFLAQIGVLAKVGFNPFAYLPGLLYNLFLISSLVILPLVALATVTRNFASMTLAILGVSVSILAMVGLTSVFPGTEIATPFLDGLAIILVICGCIAVILLQYAARRIASSWVVLVVTLGIVAALACAAPDQALMGRRYPAEQAPGVVLTSGNEADGGSIVSVARSPHDVVINVPMHVSGIAPGSMMISEALRVTLEAPDGSHWTSFWQPTYDRFLADKLLPGERIARAAFIMPRSLYEKLKPMPLHVHITLAFVRARQGETTTVRLPLDDFQVPGLGICTPQTGFFYKPYEIGGISCRAALRRPSLTFVRVNWSYDDCHVPTQERGNVDGEAWVGSLNRPPAEFAIAPVWSDPIGFTNQEAGYRSNEPRHICPGTPATFTSYQAAGRTQAAFDISGLVLPELSRGQVRVMATP